MLLLVPSQCSHLLNFKCFAMGPAIACPCIGIRIGMLLLFLTSLITFAVLTPVLDPTSIVCVIASYIL